MNAKLSGFFVTLAVPFFIATGLYAGVRQPNVVVILIDDMGWADSSTYGSTYYETPNLTRLAEEGMVFTNAYAASPLCSPTRASIMSGQHPSRLRMTQAVTPKDVFEPVALPPANKAYCGVVENRNHLPLDIVTLPEALKEKDYLTAHIGKWHLVPLINGWKDYDERYSAEEHGFDFVIGGQQLPGPPDYYSPYQNGIKNLSPGAEGEYLNERLAEESINWIRSVENSDQPFFLNLWHYAVHGPIIPNKALLPKYEALRDPNANQRLPEMGTMLESLDNSLGILLDWLDLPENLELKENTVIFLTSDNGGVTHRDLEGDPWTSNRPLRGGKASTYEGGVRVPWIVSWPGHIEPGTVCDTPVQSVDIYPTVLELANVSLDRSQPIDGQSIVPLLNGDSMDRQPVFTHFPHLFGHLSAPSTSVRLDDWKLIRFHHAGANAASDAFELFNLKLDPYEAIELSTYYPEKVLELNLLIDEHLQATDALLPIRNNNFQGNPRKSRTNPKKAPRRPKKLYLAESAIQTNEAGERQVQLLDEYGQPRKTNALVLEGDDWVRVESRTDGVVNITWDTPPADASARVLFGWKGGATSWEINDWTMAPSELLLGPSVEPVVSDHKPAQQAAFNESQPLRWSEGFNSDFSNPYVTGSFGHQFGVRSPGVITDGSLMGVEGDGFAALNTRRMDIDGAPMQIGGMDLNLGTVRAADVTYIFTGKFGWRYGPVSAARDLVIFDRLTGFLIDGERAPSMEVPAFNFGDARQSRLDSFSFKYTTTEGDVGKRIGLRLRLADLNKESGLTQLLADDWVVLATTER
ncbi:MAG: sulfatase [Verrucomicrobiota bacterium]